MAIHALISGVLWKTPEQRVSKTTGKSFTMATLRVKDGDETQWIKLLAFGTDTQAELMRLGDGDVLSVTGSLGAQIYAPSDREARITSLALQFGCPVEVIGHALTKDAGGGPATVLGAALSALAIVDLEVPPQ